MKARSGRIISGSGGARTKTIASTAATCPSVASSSTRRSAKRQKRDEPSAVEEEKRDDFIIETFVADYKFAPHEDPHVKRLQLIAQTLSLPGGAAIRRVLYPGCWIHISPSLVFPDVTYVDSFTGRKNLLKTFFQDNHSLLLSYLEAHKLYPEAPSVTLRQQDYRHPVPNVEPQSMDLLISLDAGAEISTTCAQYVRPGGYLYVNDGHGDACRAFASPCVWKLCGALEQPQSPEDAANKAQQNENNDDAENDCRLLTSPHDLERYFVHQKKREKGRRLTAEEAGMNAGMSYSKRPMKCQVDAQVYVFQRL